MKIAIVAGLLLVLSGTASAQKKLLDRIVAIVNGYPILHSEVQRKVDEGPLTLVSEYPADDTSPAYERAMQDAINFELVLQKARDLDIEVEEIEVEQEIGRFLESRGLDKDGLLEFLTRQGKTYDEYKEDFRNLAIKGRFQGRVIAPLVKITDKDVETYYLKKSGTTSDLLELQLRQILIRVDAGSSPEIIKAKEELAGEVHARLSDGMEFTDAVKIYSSDEAARENGGLMAGIKLKDLAGQIRAEVEALDVGKFTVPIRTSLGFHIFYLEDKRFAGSSEFLSKKKELEYELRNIEVITQTRKWLATERQKTKIEILK